MNRFLLITLTAGLISPIAGKAEPIPKISDWDATFTQPYRLLFTCPAVITKEINEGRLEKKSTSLYPECWVDFHKNHMDIMGKQIIERKNVLRHWNAVDGISPVWRTHHFIYLDQNGQRKLFPAMIKVKIGPSRRVEKKGDIKYMRHLPGKNPGTERFNVELDVINHWMAQ